MAAIGLVALGACSALPTSAPQEREIFEAEKTAANSIGFHIVDVTPPVVAALATAPEETLSGLGDLGAARRVDTIGVGDVLTISVFEVGSTLFGPATGSDPGTDAGAGAAPALTNTGAARHTLSGLQVDGSGSISFPYVGRVRVAGRTPTQVGSIIEGGLKAKSQDPQVVVSISSNLANTVIVSGDVAHPGRIPLSLGHERLIDTIALAGGPTKPDGDTYVQVTRRGVTSRILLQRLTASPQQDITLMPQDRIQLVYKPRTFTAFGATQKIEQIKLDATSVTLAEGIARSGGPANERADANAVFLVRYEGPQVARQLGLTPQLQGTPIMYRLDMLNPTSYFLATKIPMRDQDVILVANARTDQIQKLFTLVSQAALPFLIGRSVAN